MGTDTISENSRYMRELREQQETDFIEKAVAGIESGLPWQTFIERHPQYTLLGTKETVKLHRDYERMIDRRNRSAVGTWGIESELQLASDNRLKSRQLEADEAFYEENKADLMKCAMEHMSWSEARGKLDFDPACEAFYRRAQREAGVSQASERTDPADVAFMMGFG